MGKAYLHGHCRLASFNLTSFMCIHIPFLVGSPGLSLRRNTADFMRLPVSKGTSAVKQAWNPRHARARGNAEWLEIWCLQA
ncbi:hypothetical protein EJ06DRAFT_534167 [Trichodelitschia bisporula]|uniref:Uncharacterized protein n=1 Tax=Trichodelitschia bisporula TaxID=703511 RepID=A0A6G1HKT3_9PEZI|nr:hypothetical protein EJ06DRAFT_534167 [Trichodelitschia bisporula]